VVSDFTKAKKRAKHIADSLAKGEAAGASMSLQDQSAFVNANRRL